jgi:hypothetical protein
MPVAGFGGRGGGAAQQTRWQEQGRHGRAEAGLHVHFGMGSVEAEHIGPMPAMGFLGGNGLAGPNPTLVSPRAIRRKKWQMKDLSDHLLHT